MFGGTNNISGNSYYYKFQDGPTIVGSAVKITEEYNGQTLRVQSCNGANVCSDWTTYVINIEIPLPEVPNAPEGE